VSETSENISYGVNDMRDGVSLNDLHREKATVHFDKLMKLPNLEPYLKVSGSYPVAKIKFQVYDLPKIAEGLITHEGFSA
jgi:hypothetical protein